MEMDKESVISLYFDECGMPTAVGKYGRVIVLNSGGSITPPPPTNGGVPYEEFTLTSPTDMILKRVGTSTHPTNYWIDGLAEKIGRRVIMDLRLYFLNGFTPGSGSDEWWLDLLTPELKPDFNDDTSLESVGTYILYGEPGPVRKIGVVYWTKNVGSGKDGIQFYPRLDGDYDGSDHVRISLSWRTP